VLTRVAASAESASLVRVDCRPAAMRKPRTTQTAPQTKRGPPGLVNRRRTASVNAIGTRASLAELAGAPRDAAAAAAGGAADPDTAAHAASTDSASAAASRASGYGTSAAATSAGAAAAPAAAAAAAAAAAPLGVLHAEPR
jgi:hypothetical protein